MSATTSTISTPKVLSVDLGHQYLAYAFLSDAGDQTSDPNSDTTNNKATIRYGIYDFGRKTDCISRCQHVAIFLQQFEPDWIVIERQLGKNYKCTQLQYALVAAASLLGIAVELQPAWTKFEVFDQPFETRGKAHKVLSSNLALEWLDSEAGQLNDVSDVPLSEYSKKDDIADAINMLRAFVATH
jgi:hypothetical protein